MHVSNRQRQIMELLLNRSEEITAGEIAEEIKVSTRTIHRELDELEALLNANGVKLQKKSGKGIQLQASKEKLELLHQLLFDSASADYSAEDRKVLMLCMLLQAEEPIKLFSLAHSLGVTVPTISHDLDELESWIHKNELSLIRRRGYGIEIRGSEIHLRSTICSLAINHLDDSDLFGKLEGLRQHPAKLKLLGLIGKENLLTVEAVLWQAESGWLNELAEHDYSELLIRISVMLTRIRHGKLIGKVEGCDEQKWLDEPLRRIIEQLSAALRISFPDGEDGYLAQLLKANKASDPNQLLPLDELGYMNLAGRLIQYLDERMQVGFSADRSLRDGLMSHLESAVLRIREGFMIRNPLLSQIKKDYEELFGLIRQAVDVTMKGFRVPDEEIGFLVMHFGASMERLKQFRRNVKAIIVCTSGIGSSKMLAIRLKKELPQIEIIDNASWYEVARIPEEEYDLIISTVDLPLEPQHYIKISPLLTKEESEKLRRFIEVTLKQKPHSGEESLNRAEPLKQLHRLQVYLNEIITLVDQFQVHDIEQPLRSLRETLLLACGYVKRVGGITDLDAVARLLIDRQKLSSQVIPDTGIALFHTRSEHILKPSLTLFRLQEDLPLENEDSPHVRNLLLMLGPRELFKEVLEVLSEISSYLLVPEMVALLKTGTEEEIRQYLSHELTGFFESIYKTDKRRTIR
jgi:mannitol operon transcriptional antiterminator